MCGEEKRWEGEKKQEEGVNEALEEAGGKTKRKKKKKKRENKRTGKTMRRKEEQTGPAREVVGGVFQGREGRQEETRRDELKEEGNR
jgi:hypothetical protein